jgi:hypothetical protein
MDPVGHFSDNSIQSVDCFSYLRGPKSAFNVNRFPPSLLPEKKQVATNGAKGFQLFDERLCKCNVVITKSNKMNQEIEQIRARIEPLRQQIIQHKVYASIQDIDDLKIFMQYHIYAVWDFMSLLKSLQNNLTCVSVPWFPKGDADTRFLINEIVVGEESDVDLHGVRKSHFELYLDAMKQCGADTSQIETFTATLQKTGDFQLAFGASNTPSEARSFVDFTFQVIGSQKNYLQSAIFTFGREDLIPGMFIAMVNDIHSHFPDSLAAFKYYLERHIEVDGDHHSHLALQMTANLCGQNESYWAEVEAATIESLQKRMMLWDGALAQITRRKAAAMHA